MLCGQVDEFTGKLWEVYETIRAEGGPVQVGVRGRSGGGRRAWVEGRSRGGGVWVGWRWYSCHQLDLGMLRSDLMLDTHKPSCKLTPCQPFCCWKQVAKLGQTRPTLGLFLPESWAN